MTQLSVQGLGNSGLPEAREFLYEMKQKLPAERRELLAPSIEQSLKRSQDVSDRGLERVFSQDRIYGKPD